MLKYFLPIAIFALSSCQTSPEPPKDLPWRYQDFNEQDYQRITTNDASGELIKTITKDYESNPWRENYTEIRLNRVLLDRDTRKKYLKFSISYVSDIYIIYEVTEDGVVDDKFLLSQW